MNKSLRALLVAAASLAAASAFAEGLSVGGSVGGSHWKGDAFGGVASDSSDTGYKLWLGWGFTPNFGLEAGYVDLGKFSGHLERDALGAGDSDRGLSWKVGLGLQYDLSKNVGIRGEWERYRFDALSVKDDTDLYTIGVNYRF